MTVKDFLESQLKNGSAELTTKVEVIKEETDATIGFMSIEDMLDAEFEYLSGEYVSTDVCEDGTITVVI